MGPKPPIDDEVSNIEQNTLYGPRSYKTQALKNNRNVIVWINKKIYILTIGHFIGKLEHEFSHVWAE